MSDLKKLQQDAIGWDWTVKLLAKRCKYTAGYNSAVRERDKARQRLKIACAGSPTAQLCAAAQLLKGDKR